MLLYTRATLYCPTPAQNNLRTSNTLTILILHLPDPLLRNNLDQHPLKINRQSPLQLIRAHPQNLDSLLVVDVRVVVLVEDGEAVVLCVAVGGVWKGGERC